LAELKAATLSLPEQAAASLPYLTGVNANSVRGSMVSQRILVRQALGQARIQGRIAMDWPMSRTVERQASRMADMMQKLDADPNKLVRLRAGEAYAEARTNCLRCCHARECLLWLDAVPTSGEAPLFCPSFGLFKTCKRAT
jgi:hypothetical protein